MFLLNVEFGNSFRVFQCHLSTVSRFPFLRYQSPRCWHRRTRVLEVARIFYQTFKMLWRILLADNVILRFYFATL